MLAAAAMLRLPLLERRPMHADEATLADKFGTLLATGAYPYDPNEHHGPVLAYLAWIPARLTGRTTYAALTEATLRSAPAAAGALLALTPLLLIPVLGPGAAVSAAVLVALSPALVYYSRYFIPEMPLALWTALFLAALLRRGRGWPLLAGAAAALMLATKETAVLALASAGCAYVLAFRPRRAGLPAAGASAAIFVLAFSVLLAPPWKWGMLLDSGRAYLQRGISGGLHFHPWYSYLEWLLAEAPVLLTGIAGVFVAWRSGKPEARFLALYAVILMALYSAVPYKTPWCAVSLVYALALLAGIAVDACRRRWRNATLAASATVVLLLATQAWFMSVPWAADPRNPWAYAHTGAGVFTIRERVAEFVRAAADPQSVAIDVYSRANLWPLPWYFRHYANVRWWREVVVPGAAAPIVLVSPDMEPGLARKLYEGPPPGERELYMNMFPGYVELRPAIEIRGYVAKSLWDRNEQSR